MIRKNIEDVISENLRYDIIYADPPWRYKNQASNGTCQYRTMSFTELVQFPVKKIAAENSVLFMWISSPMLLDCVAVMDRWGYSYKTVAFCWFKQNKTAPGTIFPGMEGVSGYHCGMGNYTRSNCEIVLLGTRGRQLKRNRRDVFQAVFSPYTTHSQKPLDVRRRIDEMYVDGLRKIELFARESSDPAWDYVGDQLEEEQK